MHKTSRLIDNKCDIGGAGGRGGVPQPRPQGFSLKKWGGREKALAAAGHVSPRTP